MPNEKSENTLQTTALVQEVFLRLVEVERVTWKDRAHFFAVSANMMRRIWRIEHARKAWASASTALHLNLDDAPQIAQDYRVREIVAIDDAMNALAHPDTRQAKVIELLSED